MLLPLQKIVTVVLCSCIINRSESKEQNNLGEELYILLDLIRNNQPSVTASNWNFQLTCQSVIFNWFNSLNCLNYCSEYFFLFFSFDTHSYTFAIVTYMDNSISSIFQTWALRPIQRTVVSLYNIIVRFHRFQIQMLRTIELSNQYKCHQDWNIFANPNFVVSFFVFIIFFAK